MKNLVIVESPTKAKTIGKFLGEDFVIKPSMGHLMDLPKSTLAVDIEHNFKPQFELIADKKKIISELKTASKSASSIILATDPDREGEAIASHVADLLIADSKLHIEKKENHKLLAISNKPISRIVFHEITREAIEEALNNPRAIDENLVDAQTARRVLDRLVGYKLSPLLWQKVRRGLSAGRVQSVALRLIVEREREIERFKKEEYFTITAFFSKVVGDSKIEDSGKTQNKTQSNAEFSVVPRTVPSGSAAQTEFELIEINGEKIELQSSFQLYDGEYKVTKTSIQKEEAALKIVEDLKTKEFKVADVLQKELRRSPQPPYTTSTLQQDASRRLGLNGKRTMSLAQKLYEEGYITYHRTDSISIALSAQKMIVDYVKKQFGEKYLPEKPRFYAAKQKLAQEAHEAIRPTKAGVDSKTVTADLGAGYAKLYELIWKRAVASQMADAITESTTVLVDSENQKSKIKNQKSEKENLYRLKANGSVLVFEGFLKVNPQGLGDKKLPEFKVSESLEYINGIAEKHETPPPPRYNDASLIKALEEEGIGRPSTYAAIISTIETRRYIERQEAKFVPTTVGVAVNDFLVENFSDIDDIPFTAEMEDRLDQIAEGKLKWQPMIKEFYDPFSKKLVEVKDAKRVKIEVEKLDEKCPECQAPLVIRIGRFGKFISCSRFPECKFTKAFVEETGLKCPKDGGNVIIKRTRKGRKFFGCSNYPKCNFAAWKKEDIHS